MIIVLAETACNACACMVSFSVSQVERKSKKYTFSGSLKKHEFALNSFCRCIWP